LTYRTLLPDLSDSQAFPGRNLRGRAFHGLVEGEGPVRRVPDNGDVDIAWDELAQRLE